MVVPHHDPRALGCRWTRCESLVSQYYSDPKSLPCSSRKTTLFPAMPSPCLWFCFQRFFFFFLKSRKLCPLVCSHKCPSQPARLGQAETWNHGLREGQRPGAWASTCCLSACICLELVASAGEVVPPPRGLPSLPGGQELCSLCDFKPAETACMQLPTRLHLPV